MVIAAAACEAQRLLSDGPDPSTLQMEFSRYAELDLPIDVAACTKGGARPPVFVTLSQAGEAIGDATRVVMWVDVVPGRINTSLAAARRRHGRGGRAYS